MIDIAHFKVSIAICRKASIAGECLLSSVGSLRATARSNEPVFMILAARRRGQDAGGRRTSQTAHRHPRPR